MFLLDYPEIKNLYKLLLDKLLNESGRGALLIATTHVDEFLEGLIIEVFPKELTRDEKKNLLKYPGHLSSFSAKIELAYSFRLINKSLRDSLNALRRLRNDAAHSSSNLELHELNEKMREVYKMGEGFAHVINKLSAEVMFEMKFLGISDLIDKLELTPEEKKQKLIELFSDKENLVVLEKQLPFWELILGTCFLCGLIVYQKEQISLLTKDIHTWASLANRISS